jgi:hypothetical protein
VGRDEAGAGREVERWQFVREWKNEGPRTDAQIEAALTDVYNEWQIWKQAFDPLPYFSSGAGDYTGPNKYVPPEESNWNNENEIGYGATMRLNQTDKLKINFARYWPPASKVPSGLTKYLSKESWNDTVKSLPPRITAYNTVKAEIEAIMADLEASLLYPVTVTLGGNTFQALQEVRDDLADVIKVGAGAVTGNLTKFEWNNPDKKVSINSNTSGPLYEAYFGFVPDRAGYSEESFTTYPLN